MLKIRLFHRTLHFKTVTFEYREIYRRISLLLFFPDHQYFRIARRYYDRGQQNRGKLVRIFYQNFTRYVIAFAMCVCYTSNHMNAKIVFMQIFVTIDRKRIYCLPTKRLVKPIRTGGATADCGVSRVID